MQFLLGLGSSAVRFSQFLLQLLTKRTPFPCRKRLSMHYPLKHRPRSSRDTASCGICAHTSMTIWWIWHGKCVHEILATWWQSTNMVVDRSVSSSLCVMYGQMWYKSFRAFRLSVVYVSERDAVHVLCRKFWFWQHVIRCIQCVLKACAGVLGLTECVLCSSPGLPSSDCIVCVLWQKNIAIRFLLFNRLLFHPFFVWTTVFLFVCKSRRTITHQEIVKKTHQVIDKIE
jgi:hypothetical protein